MFLYAALCDDLYAPVNPLKLQLKTIQLNIFLSIKNIFPSMPLKLRQKVLSRLKTCPVLSKTGALSRLNLKQLK